jgi:toxin ParE1/3/4
VKVPEFSPESRLDLIEIVTYIARDNPARARTFVTELETACSNLVAHPEIGALRPELHKSLRIVPHGRYLIFYQALKDTVRIERILHGARNISALFNP